MSWNYRVTSRTIPGSEIAKEQTLYSIREVYYAYEGTILSYTDRPIIGEFESVEELFEDLKLMSECNRDVLKIDTYLVKTIHSEEL